MSETKKSNREHAFDFELAVIIGIEKAILLKNISFWCEENEKFGREKYHSNDIWWTKESLNSLARKYPYMKRASIGRWMQELFDDGWIRLEQEPAGANSYAPGRVFEAWNKGQDWEEILSQYETKKTSPKLGQSVSQNETVGVSEWDEISPKVGHNNVKLDSDLFVEKDDKTPAAIAAESAGPKVQPVDAKNGSGSKAADVGAGAGPKNWSKEVARIFDEVNLEKTRYYQLEYTAFNWNVCADENFKQLRNLKDKAIIPDYKTKFKTDPDSDQLMATFRAVFRLAWDYFYDIHKRTGNAAIHYTPTSIYRSYNSIKTTASKRGINGNSTNNSVGDFGFGQGIDDNGTFDKERGY